MLIPSVTSCKLDTIIMPGDRFELEFNQSVQAQSGAWYRNYQVLGSGGNAVTFLVHCSDGPYVGLPFALKVFRKLSKPERRTSFLTETQFLGTQTHPAIM